MAAACLDASRNVASESIPETLPWQTIMRQARILIWRNTRKMQTNRPDLANILYRLAM
jgi:hypothetical protein